MTKRMSLGSKYHCVMLRCFASFSPKDADEYQNASVILGGACREVNHRVRQIVGHVVARSCAMSLRMSVAEPVTTTDILQGGVKQ